MPTPGFPHSLTLRTTKEMIAMIKAQLKPGERMADWWRDAASAKLRQAERERREGKNSK